MERDLELLRAYVRAWWAAMMLRDCHGEPDHDSYLAQREYALARASVMRAGLDPEGACGWAEQRVKAVLDEAVTVISRAVKET